MTNFENEFEKCEILREKKEYEKAANILEDIVRKTKPKDDAYDKAFANLLDILKFDLGKSEQDYLDADIVTNIFAPYHDYMLRNNEFPYLSAAMVDIRDPPGLLNFIMCHQKLGYYCYHLATLQGNPHLENVSQAEQLILTGIETIEQYKHRISAPLDIFLCGAYNTLGNTLVERARYFSSPDSPEILENECNKYNAHGLNSEQAIMHVCLQIVKKAMAAYQMCLENNPFFTEKLDQKSQEAMDEIRNDARDSIKYVTKLIRDPVRFIDLVF